MSTGYQMTKEKVAELLAQRLKEKNIELNRESIDSMSSSIIEYAYFSGFHTAVE